MQQRYYCQHRLNPRCIMHVSQCGSYIYPLEDAGPVVGTSPVLADYVDYMVDWDSHG
jgi:hypothetical protein